MMLTGLATNQSARPAHVVEPVRSYTQVQAHDGSVPHDVEGLVSSSSTPADSTTVVVV